FPPDRTGGGVAPSPRDSPRLAAAGLCHLTSPTHCRRGSSTCRYFVDRHPRSDASDPTDHRARPPRSPSAGQSVPPSSQEPVRAPHPTSAIRAHGNHVTAGRRARGRRIAYLGVSATTLP